MSAEIVLRGIGSISALGYGRESVWHAYEQGQASFRSLDVSGGVAVYAIRDALLAEALRPVAAAVPRIEELDRVVQLGCVAAQAAAQDAEERGAFALRSARRVAVLIGTARGATATLERALALHLQGTDVPLTTSPMTTMGIVSSTVAQSLRVAGMSVDVSMTCTSGLHALLLGRALLANGDVDAVVVGAAEAALTPFTLSQVAALRLSPPWDPGSGTPCRPLDGSPGRRARLVLGEAACIAILTRADSASRAGAGVVGVGFGAEIPPSLTGIAPDGGALRGAMQDALLNSGLSKESVEAIAPHAPGTVKGDTAELAAIASLFGKLPPLLTTKFLTGHTYAVAGMLSLELAEMVLNGLRPAPPPYATTARVCDATDTVQRILINAAGFGGNAISCLIGRST